VEIYVKKKRTFRASFITSLAVTAANVAALTDCARARWKIENEGFHIWKNNGSHMEHNFGHGAQNLSNVRLTLNLIALALHTVWDGIWELWQQARQLAGTRRGFFSDLESLCKCLLFDHWTDWLQTMGPPQPPP